MNFFALSCITAAGFSKLSSSGNVLLLIGLNIEIRTYLRCKRQNGRTFDERFRCWIKLDQADVLQMQPLPVHLSPLSVGLNHITHKIERVRASEEEGSNGPRRSFNCGPPTSCRRRRRGRGERGGRREGSERRAAASSTVRGERERGRGAARAARALRLWTSMVGGRTDGSGEGEGALRDERLGQRESGGTGRLQLVHYN